MPRRLHKCQMSKGNNNTVKVQNPFVPMCQSQSAVCSERFSLSKAGRKKEGYGPLKEHRVRSFVEVTTGEEQLLCRREMKCPVSKHVQPSQGEAVHFDVLTRLPFQKLYLDTVSPYH